MYVRVTSKGQITIPHEVRNQHLIISPTANMDKLQNLKKRKHAIKGDPEGSGHYHLGQGDEHRSTLSSWHKRR